MFTREELIGYFHRLPWPMSLHLEIVEFVPTDFRSFASEESIKAWRGEKSFYTSALQFWRSVLQVEGWSGKELHFLSYTEACLFQSISKAEFSDIVLDSSGLLQRPLPRFLTDLDGFKSGLRMLAEWNDVTVMAELSGSFIAYSWSTTA